MNKPIFAVSDALSLLRLRSGQARAGLPYNDAVLSHQRRVSITQAEIPRWRIANPGVLRLTRSE